MADAKKLVDALKAKGASLYAGVPDSLLSKLSACIMQQPDLTHIITANEGNAVGLSIGEYLGTGRPGVVYMQNSGLGNVVNPLASLADPEIYGIPMFLIVGWRGEPGVRDEPQHIKQGAVTLQQLEVLGIPYLVFDDKEDIERQVDALWRRMLTRKGPVALVIRKGALTGDWSVEKYHIDSSLKREQALDCLLDELPETAFYVATTGKTGRELFELRARRKQNQRDFLTVGGMGHASSIALGVSLRHPEKMVVCLDGDGAALMHLGAMATIGSEKPKNFVHVLLNNAAHESVGGQPTIANGIDFKKFSQAVGYAGYACANDEKELRELLSTLGERSPFLLEIKLLQGSRQDLGRPTRTPAQNKESVMDFLME